MNLNRVIMVLAAGLMLVSPMSAWTSATEPAAPAGGLDAINQAIDRVRAQDQELADEIQEDLAPVRSELAGGRKEMTAEGHKASGTGPLDWQNDLALWTGIIFLVLLLVLWKFAWGPIADGLAKREKGIANQISEAEQANNDARRLLAEYQQKLAMAAEDVRKMSEQGRRDAEQSGRQIVEAARGDARAEHERALAEIDQATNNALAELAQRSAQLAVELAGKIVKAELRPSDHVELVQQAVAGFTKTSDN
ncbi:MAG: F0F1 ATP synthase subunit B [Pirellulales bacterium]|nr:F0F1 ATP synthase subunit B [Pirellulales bacterium]